MGDIIELNKPPTYIVRTHQDCYSRNPKVVRYGTETISFLTPKIWTIAPQNMKNSSSLSSFKINIWKWKPDCLVTEVIFFKTSFYLKNYQSNKKFTEHKDYYSALFFFSSLTYFEPLFPGRLGISMFLGHI